MTLEIVEPAIVAAIDGAFEKAARLLETEIEKSYDGCDFCIWTAPGVKECDLHDCVCDMKIKICENLVNRIRDLKSQTV